MWKYGNTGIVGAFMEIPRLGNTRIIGAFLEIKDYRNLHRNTRVIGPSTYSAEKEYSKWIQPPAETLMIPDSQVTTSTKSDNHKR